MVSHQFVGIPPVISFLSSIFSFYSSYKIVLFVNCYYISFLGKYVYSNSEEESVVYVYSVASGKVVYRLTGEHTAIVRGLATTTTSTTSGVITTHMLATASYDKSVVLWT